MTAQTLLVALFATARTSLGQTQTPRGGQIAETDAERVSPAPSGQTYDVRTFGAQGDGRSEPGPDNEYQDFGHSHWHNSLMWGDERPNGRMPIPSPACSG